MVEIVKIEATKHDVKLILSDGKHVHICPHEDRLHLHFSNVERVLPIVGAANQVNVHIVPKT